MTKDDSVEEPATKKAKVIVTDNDNDIKDKTTTTTTTTKYMGTELELKCINTIRTFCADMVQAANSGHPGAPMGCAPMAFLLWSEIMKYSPSNPKWYNRDRFVLSNGHACALQYCMLHLVGYDVTLDDCKAFRQCNSKTPGHPESFATPGVEVCTGPLGQGISNAVGMAIAERHLSAVYNEEDIDDDDDDKFKPIDNYTFVICGDGCLQEGVSSETCSLAGHLGLGKLIVLYDDNGITIDGSTELSFTEDVGKRYEAYGWQVLIVNDVSNGLDELRNAITLGKKERNKPTLIKIKTIIGHGSVKQGSEKTHGSPLGSEDIQNVKIKFGLDPTKHFYIDDDVQTYWNDKVQMKEKQCKEWEAKFDKYTKDEPQKAKELKRRLNGELLSMDEMKKVMPKFQYGKDKELATRKHSEICLNALAPIVPELIGGSADLTHSNLTSLKCTGDFQHKTPAGRYIRFGVREHGMSAICNGIYAYGALRPFCATFLNFAGYALGAIRLSALSKFGVLYIMTHDSIGLGEDGPTHQPMEMLEALRATPNMNVYRPADSNETVAAYLSALEHVHTPTIICCSRSTVPALKNSTVEDALKGGYILHNGDDDHDDEPKLILIGTGTEVGLCIQVAESLLKNDNINVRVVSMPCQELFLKQSKEYQIKVLPGNIPTMSVEAGCINGWYKFAHYPFGMTTFGVSGKGKDVFSHFGFTVENLLTKGKELLEYYKDKNVPNLADRPWIDTDTTKLDGH